jgi:hypothetical protein
MSSPDDRFGNRDSSRPRRQPVAWSVGDRVLAPWEPEYLYAGTVSQIQDEDVHIDFDDGDSGWVPLSELCPLQFEVDQPVLCRKEMGALFYPATVADMSGETVHVTFDDGGDEWTTVAALRVPRKAGPGASPTRLGAERGPAIQLQRGLRVLAPWESFFLYPATIIDIQNDDVHVQFDDGDAGWVGVIQIHPLQLPAGLMVTVRGSGRLYRPAEVVCAEGEEVAVRLESGATVTVPLAAVRVPCLSAGPNARPTSVSGGPGLMGWLIPLLVLVALGVGLVLLSL